MGQVDDSFVRGVAKLVGLILEGKLTRQRAQDAADAVGVQAGALGDLGERVALSPEPQDRAMFHRAAGDDAVP